MLAFVKPKIILLDDDQSLLDVIGFYFKEQFGDSVFITTFSRSNEFLAYLQDFCFLPDSPHEILTSFYNSEMNEDFAIQCLNDLFQTSAIVVLDQELRDENVTGIDISAKIREYYPNSYISMLTSNVPSSTAIQLHNNHNIDLFVDKKDTDAIINLYNYLSQQVSIMNQQYKLEPFEVFSNCHRFEDDQFIKHRDNFLLIQNPVAYITINNRGDIALMNKDMQTSFWKHEPNEYNFIKYEY